MNEQLNCGGNCLKCPFPEVPQECSSAPVTYEEYRELRAIDREILFPKTRKQRQNAVYGRRYYESHREQVLERCRRWREENRDHIRARGRKYHREHKDEDAARWRKRYSIHRREILAERKKWREENPDYFREYYRKNKEAIDTRFQRNREVYGPKQAVIREARAARGWTQKELAQILGLHYKTIACWETGRNPANWERLYEAMPELKGSAVDVEDEA